MKTRQRHRNDPEPRIRKLETTQMALSKEVQDALDRIAQNKSLADSLAAADKLRDQQIADLKKQIADLPVGQSLSQEDHDALVKAASDLDNTNSELQSAIPANTNGAAAADNANGTA